MATLNIEQSIVGEVSFSKTAEVKIKQFRETVTLDQDGFDKRNARILIEQKGYAKEGEKVQGIKQSQAVFDDFRINTITIEANILLGEEEIFKRDQMAFVMGQGQWAVSNLASMHVINY
jgi:hypothetical protein